MFLRVFAERRKLRAVRRVRPYLYRMMANACADRLRRRKRRGERFVPESDCRIEDIADNRETAPAQVAAAEDVKRVERLLAGLPKRQAEVVRLRVLDELPFSDIAVVVGCRLSTVKSRLRYGLLKLRRIVKREAQP